MQTLFYFLNLLDSLSIVLYVFSCELIAHLNKGQAEFFWCKNMFHRPLFYIVSLYTCVTLSDFLIHKKFIFKLTKAPLQTIKKQYFLTLQLQQVYGNVRMLAMTSSNRYSTAHDFIPLHKCIFDASLRVVGAHTQVSTVYWINWYVSCC